MATATWHRIVEKRHYCACCDHAFSTPSRLKRHEASTDHWLCKEFSRGPDDVKAVVASFLPISKLCGLQPTMMGRVLSVLNPWPVSQLLQVFSLPAPARLAGNDVGARPELAGDDALDVVDG